jgi:hypothetical protein
MYKEASPYVLYPGAMVCGKVVERSKRRSITFTLAIEIVLSV